MPLVSLWLSEVIINNLSNLISICRKVNLKSNYINSYSDPLPLVSLWLSEVVINNLSNLISIYRKVKIISNYTLIFQSLTISLAMAFGGNSQ